MCLEARELAQAGSERGPAAGAAPPRNGPSRLRRDSAGPGGRPCPPHPPQPEPRAAANAAAPAPDAARRLLAVGRAVGLRGRGRRPPPGPRPRRRRVPALRPRGAPARPAAPAGGRQLLQPPAPAAAAHLRALRAPGALAQPQPQPPGRVLAQRLALAPPALPSCSHMQYQSVNWGGGRHRENALRPDGPQYWLPSLGQGRGPGPPYLPFSFRPGWGKRKETPKNQQKTQNRRLFICF